MLRRGIGQGWVSRVLLLLCIGTGIVFLATRVMTFVSGNTLIVKDARARPANQDMTGAVYLTLENPTAHDEKLTSVTAPIADVVELHQTVVENNIVQMVPIPELLIPSGDKVMINPGGYHLMLIGLRQDLNEGDTFPITLHFASGYEVTLDVFVGWGGPPAKSNKNTVSPSVNPGDLLPNELRIIIPEGTGELIEAGQNPEIIPDEIRLKLGEQNILTIINNDSVNHAVGPFFIRAGEFVRQEFSSPGVYEGGCSIHQEQHVQIIVED